MANGVYKAIAAVMADLAHQGVSKSQRNAAQGYSFRGIDDLYNALAPLLSKHGLVIRPCITKRESTDRESVKPGKSGSLPETRLSFHVVVEATYTLISVEDGSSIETTTYGEAIDSSDKATNKAMSAAYKYMLLQTFCIPTEGDNDADASSPEVVRTPEPSLADVQKTPEYALAMELFPDEPNAELTNTWIKDIAKTVNLPNNRLDSFVRWAGGQLNRNYSRDTASDIVTTLLNQAAQTRKSVLQ